MRHLKYIKFFYKKPRVVWRIINNYRNLINKKSVLKKVDLGITFDCQCSCDKCSSYKMRNSKKRRLTFEEYRRIARECISLGALQINLTGGEPLLEPNILHIIECLVPRTVFISINTNGLLLTESHIRRFKELGVDMVKFSLDSSIPEEHDKSRGVKGCFEGVMRALTMIKEIGGIRGHISVVTTPNIVRSGKIYEIVQIAEKFNVSLALTIPALAGKWSNQCDMLINEKDREILNKLLKHPLVTTDTYTGYAQIMCPAGIESLYITCYGDVIPCPVLQISFGNIRFEPLAKIYQRMHTFFSGEKVSSICRAGEDKEFIEKYLSPIGGYDSFPVSSHLISSFNRQTR